jgi:hypothetical protein
MQPVPESRLERWLRNLGNNASSFVRYFKPKLVDGILAHDCDPRAMRSNNCFGQIRKLETNAVELYVFVHVNMEEISRHERGTLPGLCGRKQRLKRRCAMQCTLAYKLLLSVSEASSPARVALRDSPCVPSL